MFNSFENLIISSNENFNDILEYILSPEIMIYEKKNLEDMNIINELIYKNKYLIEKKKFYENFNIYTNSKLKKQIPEWMLNRILILDIENITEKIYKKIKKI